MKNETLTAAEFENAGYSRTDAQRKAADPSQNWKAANGGKRSTRQPIDYTQARAGDGKDGPAVDAWRPWKHSTPIDRETMIQMATKKYLREAGFEGGHFERPHVFTVWHYREGDPCHPNGRPMTVTATTMAAHPNRATA